jgi:CRP-like cAMP-binding protein
VSGTVEGRRPKRSKKPHSPLLYESVPDGVLADEVLKRSKPFSVPGDRILFREGAPPNGIFVVRTGSVTLTKRLAGRKFLRARAEAGSLLGLPSTVSGSPYSMSAKACSCAEIEHLSCDSYRELMQVRSGLCIDVVKILANEVRAVRQALAEILG